MDTDDQIRALLAHLTREINSSMLSLREAQIALEKASTKDATAKARRRVSDARADLLEIASLYQRLKEMLRAGL